ncbi:MAG: hypothetical protein SF187_31000 [Deltaproteobacteria bacterium]|nr:hypothetical protein [Deltaproteobacteria bacterium]
MLPLASRLITLSSPSAVAQIYPERGFQLFGFQVKHGDAWIETIHAVMDPFEPADRRYGNPVLFPAVGVSNGSAADAWDYEGRPLPMPPHGWARNVYWQIQEQTESSLTASVVPHPGFKLGFPFDFEVRLTYRVEGTTLHIESVVRNSGDKPFPYAFGFHPYLRIPAVSAACLIDLPAGTRVRSADGWRTFESEPFAARTISASDADLPSSIVLKDTGAVSLEVRDEAAQTATRVSVEGSLQPFPVWVAWNASASAPYICLEPWTDLPNALNRSGTLTLAAGQSHRYHTAISLRAL